MNAKWDMGIQGLEISDHDVNSRDGILSETISGDFYGHPFSYTMKMDETTETVVSDDFESEDPWFELEENSDKLEYLLESLLKRFE